jgi:hypothetical protein
MPMNRTLLAAATLLLALTCLLACSASKGPCEEVVLKHLKAPATADFSIKYSDHKETIGWVDSESSFGARLRTGFVCTIGSDSDLEVTADDKPRIAFVDEPMTNDERLRSGRPILNDQWLY